MKKSLKKNVDLIDDKNNINEITIIYKYPIDNKLSTKLFDYKFAWRYKNKCKIIYNSKQYDLEDEFHLKNINKIKLTGIKEITNMSYMFYNCDQLLYLPDIDKMDTSNVTNMSNLFNGCKSLLSLPDISKWNTNDVKDMSFLFYQCKSLKSFPDISKWNTINVTNMESMF